MDVRASMIPDVYSSRVMERAETPTAGSPIASDHERAIDVVRRLQVLFA
jgi:hypothetical protein